MARTVHLSFEFAVTPRFDIFYALYTLSSNAATPLEQWKERASERLPSDFLRSAKRVAPLPIFWPLLADAAQEVPGEASFSEILSALRELEIQRLQRNILSGIFHDATVVDGLTSGKKTLKQVAEDGSDSDLLGHFGLRPYDSGSAAARALSVLLTRAEAYRADLIAVLQEFWTTGFNRDWAALEPELRAESFRLRDLQEDESPAELGRELNLPVTLDDGAGQLRPKTGTPLAYDRIDRCYIIPSAFNTRRWWTKYGTDSRVTLYLPITTDINAANRIDGRARASTAKAAAGHPKINAESVFRALGDTTRYAIASILARTPTTSAELARSLKVSKPTITHHVHALRSAGLIKETPSGGSTKLSLSRDTVAALSGAAVDQLFSSTGALSLDTTRKRRS